MWTFTCVVRDQNNSERWEKLMRKMVEAACIAAGNVKKKKKNRESFICLAKVAGKLKPVASRTEQSVACTAKGQTWSEEERPFVGRHVPTPGQVKEDLLCICFNICSYYSV